MIKYTPVTLTQSVSSDDTRWPYDILVLRNIPLATGDLGYCLETGTLFICKESKL